MMIRAALRDLQFRRRRFFVAILGAALVLALGMIMSGLSDSFGNEAHRTVALAGADSWVVATGAPGPFTTATFVDDTAVASVRSTPGVKDAEPILVTRQAVTTTGAPVFSNLIGIVPGKTGEPHPTTGHALGAPGDAIVDRRLHAPIGSTFTIAGHAFTVTGTVRSSLFAGAPNVYVAIDEARQLGLGGAPLASAILIHGVMANPPAGLKTLTPSQAAADALQPLKSANQTIAFIRTLLWLVAALVVGSVLYLNALERTRDMAVFKATGSSGRSIAAGLAVQAGVVALLAAAVAALIATALVPRFPMAVELSTRTYLLLPVVALTVALLGAIGGMRRALTVPPALAFGAP